MASQTIQTSAQHLYIIIMVLHVHYDICICYNVILRHT